MEDGSEQTVWDSRRFPDVMLHRDLGEHLFHGAVFPLGALLCATGFPALWLPHASPLTGRQQEDNPGTPAPLAVP